MAHSLQNRKRTTSSFSYFLQKRTSRDSHASLVYPRDGGNLDRYIHGIAHAWPCCPDGSHGSLAAYRPGMAASRELARYKRLSLPGTEAPSLSGDSSADYCHAKYRCVGARAAKRLKLGLIGPIITLLQSRRLNRDWIRSPLEVRQSSSPIWSNLGCYRRSSF